MTAQRGFDFGHTPRAEYNRRAKAHRLAVAARDLGLQPYELAVVGGSPATAAARLAVRKLARLPEPSVETWSAAMGQLEGLARSLPGTGPCPRCGWPVLTIVTERGRPLMIDPFPHPDGVVWPVETREGQRARVLGASMASPDDTPLYRQHSTTCPDRTPTKPVPAVLCRVCRQPLWMPLVLVDPTYTVHPTCDPGG